MNAGYSFQLGVFLGLTAPDLGESLFASAPSRIGVFSSIACGFNRGFHNAIPLLPSVVQHRYS